MNAPHPRLAARARRQRLRSAWPLVALAALAALATAAAVLLLASGLFDVSRVTVTGTSRLTPAQVRAAADVRLGGHLVTLDVAGIRRRVRRLPAVASVRVERDWPSTVRITVTERRPVAAASAPGGYRLLDPGAVPFATVATLPRGVVPLTLPGPVPGAGEGAARAALAVLDALPAQVHAQVTAVAVPTPAAVTLTLRGGRRVVWGGPEDSARKARVLAVLLGRPAHEYDVSAPGVAVTR